MNKNTLNKWTKEFLIWGLLILMVYFWTISLILLLILALIFGGFFYIFYRLAMHISKYKTFEEAKKNKPLWFIFGNKVYIRFIETIQKKSTETQTSKVTRTEINSAMEFYDFYSSEEVSKYEIKHRWKEIQKIYHPDSGRKPDSEKSKLANKYKDILLNAIKNRSTEENNE
jgi:hypothetical protein